MTSTLVLFYLIYRNLLVFHFFLPLSDVEVQQPVKSWKVFCISLCYFISHDVLKIKWHSFNPLLSLIYCKKFTPKHKAGMLSLVASRVKSF